jgi:hypothetical protein
MNLHNTITDNKFIFFYRNEYDQITGEFIGDHLIVDTNNDLLTINLNDNYQFIKNRELNDHQLLILAYLQTEETYHQLDQMIAQKLEKKKLPFIFAIKLKHAIEYLDFIQEIITGKNKEYNECFRYTQSLTFTEKVIDLLSRFKKELEPLNPYLDIVKITIN